MRFNRTSLRALLMVPVAAMLSLIPGVSASAAPLTNLTCTISGVANVSPGVELLSQQQQVSIKVQGGTEVSPATPCTSITDVPYTGFTTELTGSGAMACSAQALEGRMGGSGEVTWNNGDKSTAEWNITTVATAPVVDVQLTAGALAGTRVVIAATATSLSGNCVLDPITNLGFGGAAEFIPAII